MCSNTGTPNNHHFPFGTNGKVVVLGVPILKHFRVFTSFILFFVDFNEIAQVQLPCLIPDGVTDKKV